MNQDIIEIKDLKMKFKKFWALKGINLKIPKSQNVAIVGSNGSGKTTLIETMLGINKKTSGSVKINISNNKIGIQFQDSNLPEGLTPRDIVDFFNAVNDVNVSNKQLLELLKLFNMEDFIDRRAHGLSGGQRQKLNVLLATIHDPELLILDEVSTGLDIVTKNDILKYFTEHFNKTKSSIIIISHDEDEIKNLTDRFIFMHLGEIIYDKPTKHVLKEFETIKKSFDEIPKKYYKKNRNDWFLETKIKNNK